MLKRIILLFLLPIISSCVTLVQPVSYSLEGPCGLIIFNYSKGQDEYGTFLAGTTQLCSTFNQGINLETGEVVDQNFDLQFIEGGRTTVVYAFQPQNGAIATMAGVTPPGYAGCKKEVLNMRQTNIPDAFKGAYICVNTRQGHIAEVKVGPFNYDNGRKIGLNAVIEITFKTWLTSK